jgi:hypothetical protein
MQQWNLTSSRLVKLKAAYNCGRPTKLPWKGLFENLEIPYKLRTAKSNSNA